MIPIRVKLKGFLCYREEQEIFFDGASIWMLTGLNGSGKSSVFDAITYALYGQHRGGATRVEDLINKQSDGFEIEFDFQQDQKCFRIHRASKRRSNSGSLNTTQQIYEFIPTSGIIDWHWQAISDTQRRTDFKDWIQDRIGLDYQAFTSSVLLLQGQAEKLLNATPSERFSVLAGVVDLEKYKNLHAAADQMRKERERKCGSFRDHLATLPEISDVDLAGAKLTWETATKEREEIRQQVQHWQSKRFEAVRWEELSAQAQQLQVRIQEQELLQSNSEKITTDWHRLQELRQMLPIVRNAVEQHCGIADAERNIEKLQKQQSDITHEKERQEAHHKQLQMARANLERSVDQELTRQTKISQERRELEVMQERLNQYDEQQRKLKKLQEQLQRMGANPEDQVRHLKQHLDEMKQSKATFVLLENFARVRDSLRLTCEREQTLSKDLQRLETDGKKIAERRTKLGKEKEELAVQVKKCHESVIQIETTLQQAQKSLALLEDVSGEKNCRLCGQSLTKEHLAAEKERRHSEYQEFQTKHVAAKKLYADVSQQLAQLEKDLVQFYKKLSEARDEYKLAQGERSQVSKEVVSGQTECTRLYQQLPESIQGNIHPDLLSDWLETVYPTAQDLTALRQSFSEIETTEKTLRQAETTWQQWQDCQTTIRVTEESAQHLHKDLPRDPGKFRERLAKIIADDDTSKQTIKAERQALANNQKELERHNRFMQETWQRLAKCQGDIQSERTRLASCQQMYQQLNKDLPDHWREAVATAGIAKLQEWRSEQQDLEHDNISEKYERLQRLQATLADLREQSRETQQQQAAISDDGKLGVPAIDETLTQLAENSALAEDKVNQARDRHSMLSQQKQQRDELSQQLLVAEKEFYYAKLAAELLGKNRLQLFLVRTAERQVVDHANGILDRLSGGELFLQLVGEAREDGNASKALELLVHNRVSADQPINVAFLSGSQKFRVAVSLALGIGQYASRQHRPIESVIIDEGFGCLDRNGKQVMIQELQNLRTQLNSILLVSHQEEIAAAFNDGYHFELKNGSTNVTRFQR